VSLNFKRSQFAAYTQEYNPHSTLSAGPFIEFDSTPGATAYGNAGQWLDGFSWQDYNTANTADVNLGTGFERIYYAGSNYYVNLVAPGATNGYSFKVKAIRSYTLTPTSNTATFQPLVSPVKNPTINTLDLFPGQAAVGLTPTIAWGVLGEAPSVLSLAGGALVVGGVAMVQRLGRKA
jgi:hypothetical protein